MKQVILTFILLFLFIEGKADQLSYQESTRLNDTSFYYISTDRKLQYNFSDQKYWFLQYRRAGVCPYYCGFNYDMLGVGYGRKYPTNTGKMFIQAGYYYVDNTLSHTNWDENIYYYLKARFDEFHPRDDFKSYEVKNDKGTFGITVGTDIPLFNSSGIKISYQYLKVKEIITGYYTDPPRFPKLWWDPVHRDLSVLSFGFYTNF